MPAEHEYWEKLNAYVDGELPPSEAAEIAAQVAGDRKLAGVVATLTRLKATTAAEGVEGASVTRVPVPARVAGRGAWAIAASLALLIAAGAAGILVRNDEPTTGMAALVQRHIAWAMQESEPVNANEAARVLVGLRQLGASAEIPDLSDAGLQLARIAVFKAAGGADGLHVGYVGSRGCRISLMIEPASPDRRSAARDSGTADIVAWSVDGIAYTLLASGMHPPRFAAIAASAEAATRSRAPLAPPVREALRGQREGSPPCVG